MVAPLVKLKRERLAFVTQELPAVYLDDVFVEEGEELIPFADLEVWFLSSP